MLLAKVDNRLDDRTREGPSENDFPLRAFDHQPLHEDARLRQGSQPWKCPLDPVSARSFPGSNHKLLTESVCGGALKGVQAARAGEFENILGHPNSCSAAPPSPQGATVAVDYPTVCRQHRW